MAVSFAPACVFTRNASDSCANSEDCRAAFGTVAYCGDDGYCDTSTTERRCELVWPPEGDEPAELLLASIVDGSLATQTARARAVELAVRDANAEGGIDGQRFGLVSCSNEENPSLDELSQLEATARIGAYLAQLEVFAVVGPPSSAAVQTLFEAEPELLIVSPSASSDDLGGLEPPASDEAPGRLWRTTAPDVLQAERIAEDITSRGITELAIVHSDDTYGVGLATRVNDLLGSAVNRELMDYDSESRLSEILATIGRGDASEILLMTSRTDEVTAFLRSAAESPRFDARTFFLTDSAANRDLLTGIEPYPSLPPRIHGTRPIVPDAETRDAFLARYSVTFGEDVRDLSFTTNAYDAAWVALYGAVWAKLQEADTSATSVARGLRHLSSGSLTPVRSSSWEDVVAAFRAGSSIDLLGTSGEIDFDPITEEVSADFEVWGVMDGELVAL